MLTKLHVILAALARGQEINLDGTQYAIVDNSLCLKGRREHMLDGELTETTIWLETGLTLNHLIRLADKQSDQDLIAIAAFNTIATSRVTRDLLETSGLSLAFPPEAQQSTNP